MLKVILYTLSCLFRLNTPHCHCMTSKDHSRNIRDGYCTKRFPSTSKFDLAMYKWLGDHYCWSVAPNHKTVVRVGKYGMYVSHHGKTFCYYIKGVMF